jgi:tripartite-type tricarboxylate transporter receptor subunit TctC
MPGLNLPRRDAVRRVLAATAVMLVCAGSQAGAQTYPANKITLIVAFAPGGIADTLARLIAQGLGERLHQAVVVENRGGAGGNIAAASVARAEPDGYTLLATTTALAINETLFTNKEFSAADFKTVAIAASSPEALVTGASNLANNLTAFLKNMDGKTINFAVPGVGTGSHIEAEYFFKFLAKAPAQIEGGKLKGLGVAADKRAAVTPNVPTYAEQGFPGFTAASWVGFFAPAKTDPQILATLNGAINAIVQTPEVQKKLTDMGFDPITGPPAQADAMFKGEVDKWGKMVKALDLSIK